MNKKINFTVEDFSVEENPSSHFAVLDMKIVSSGMNLHNLPIKEEAIERASKTLFGKPVLTHYMEKEDALGGHDPEQVPIGTFLDSDIRIEKEGNLTWLYSKAYVWKKYFPKVLEVFKKQNGKTNISMEIEVNDSEIESDGYEWIKDFSFLGVTAIGVTPAITGSGATVLQFSEILDEAKKEFFGKYDSINFKIPNDVKEAAESGLNLRKEYGRGGTSVGMATARYLVKNQTASPEKVRHIAKYFPRHAGDNLDDKTSNGWIAWQLWGGYAGRRWSESLVKRMNAIDEKKPVSMSIEFAKEDMGKGEEVKVNKSKEALSNKPWGEVDKIELRNKVLEAKNYKSIIKDVYLLIEEGWEDSPSSHLKYPVMEFLDGELVYNRGGLSSALGYAKKENETEVVSKIMSIYKKLDIQNEEEELENKEEKKIESSSPEQVDEKKENKQDEKFEDKKEDFELESEEELEEEKEDVEMSGDAYSDVAATMAMLGEETEEMKEMAALFACKEKDFAKITSAMYSVLKSAAQKMKDMKEEREKEKEEFESLKKFKSESEQKWFSEKVEGVIKEVKEFMAPQEIEVWTEKAKSFSFETFEAWEKEIKAHLFSVIKNKGKEESNLIIPFSFNNNENNNKKYIW